THKVASKHASQPQIALQEYRSIAAGADPARGDAIRRRLIGWKQLKFMISGECQFLDHAAWRLSQIRTTGNTIGQRDGNGIAAPVAWQLPMVLSMVSATGNRSGFKQRREGRTWLPQCLDQCLAITTYL